MYGVAFLQSGLIRNTYFFFLPTQVLLSTRTWVRFSEWLHTWALSRLLICWLVWLPPFVWSSTFLLLWSWASSSFCGFGCIPPSVDLSNFLLLWIRVVSPFCDSSSFLLLWTRATTFWKSEYCNIVGRSGLCEFVCTHVTVGEFAFWNNPADQSGGNAAGGRRWAFEQTFERWQHQYQQCIPSHPMLSNDKQRALPHNTALCLLVLAAEKSGLGGSSHF